MAISYASELTIIAFLFLAGLTQSQTSFFDSFTDDVKNALPTSIFFKLFKFNHDSINQVDQALTNGGTAFAATLDTSVPDNIVHEISNRATKFANLTPEQTFKAYARALSGTLGDQGVLYSGNRNDVVNSYVDELKDAANSLDGENVLNTVPAIANACAKVLKSYGLSGFQLVLVNFANNLIQGIDMAGN